MIGLKDRTAARPKGQTVARFLAATVVHKTELGCNFGRAQRWLCWPKYCHGQLTSGAICHLDTSRSATEPPRTAQHKTLRGHRADYHALVSPHILSLPRIFWLASRKNKEFEGFAVDYLNMPASKLPMAVSQTPPDLPHSSFSPYTRPAQTRVVATLFT